MGTANEERAVEMALQLAIGVLLVSLVGAVVLGVRSGWGVQAKERAEYRRRCRSRDEGRLAVPVDELFSRHYVGPPIEVELFREIWESLASYLEIDPELMRPTDRVADLMMVSTKYYGPDSLDLLEFFQDFLPDHMDANEVLQSVCGDENESVGDLVGAVVSRLGAKE